MEVINTSTVVFTVADLKQILFREAGFVREVKVPEVDHQYRLGGCFFADDKNILTRGVLVARMQIEYDCGVNKITRAGGYLNEAVSLGLLKKHDRSRYEFTPKNKIERVEPTLKIVLAPDEKTVHAVILELSEPLIPAAIAH